MSYSLHRPANVRLAQFRKVAAAPNWVRPMTWRDVRFSKLNSTSTIGTGFNDNGKTPVWYCFGPYFEREQYADEVRDAYIKHTGWFCDEYQDRKTRGLVVALPHGKFLSGYEFDEGMRTYFYDIFDSAEDAARNADHEAQKIAEDERDYSGKFNKANDISQGIATAENRLRECIALRHKACMSYVREEITELCEKIRGLRVDFAEYAEFV